MATIDRFAFGSGYAFARPVGGNIPTNATPIELGSLQNVGVDFSYTLKELKGQNLVADDVKPADLKITGKGTFAQLYNSVIANAFTGTNVATGRKRLVVREAGTVPAVTTFTVTVANAVKFNHDFGVQYESSGLYLTRVSTGPTVGQYSVDEATGVYTFAAADANAAVLINYDWSDTVGSTVSFVNQPQGYGPTLELLCMNPTTDNKELRLYAVRPNKFTRPTKQGDYLLSEFDFEAFANSSGQVFDFYEG